MSSPLRGKTIAILATDGFEQSELTEPKRAVEEAALARCLIKRERGADHRGKIRGEAGEFQFAVAIGMAEPVAARHRPRNKIEGLPRQVDPGCFAKQQSGIGERRDHQPVPVGQHFIVEARAHPACPGGKELFA